MWWVVGALALLLVVAYLGWLEARVDRLHGRADAAARALDAKLVRRAAAAAVLADELVPTAPAVAADLYAAARAALDAAPADREAAENDLTRVLRDLPVEATGPEPAWPEVVTASRRVGLARQVHTDVVRDAHVVRGLKVVRLLRLAGRHGVPAYFDIGDPVLEARNGPAEVAVSTATGPASGA
jgi:hypothetical protein